VSDASRKQIVASISFYCHDELCYFIRLFLVAIKKSLAHLTFEERKISKPNCFVLTKLKIKNCLAQPTGAWGEGKKTWEGKKGRLTHVVSRPCVSSVAPLMRPDDGGGFAAAKRWPPHPPFRRLDTSVATSTPRPPPPAPRRCLRTKGEQTTTFFTINNRL
jgi:hypothetical protein